MSTKVRLTLMQFNGNSIKKCSINTWRDLAVNTRTNADRSIKNLFVVENCKEKN